MMKKLIGFFALSLSFYFGLGQGMQKLPLQDLSGFQDQSGNWQIVGEVSMDPNVDIHHQREAPGKKRKKNKTEPPKAVTTSQGRGILVNLPTENQKSNLITAWEHGDIELELEVMLPKGSNSGLYLQGRYEIQLLDSWGVKNPKFSDIGGIYRNWESTPDKSYMGKAPLTNAAKAPGLWQKLAISFRAPKFDASGHKIANARIVSAHLNGVLIHDNVEVPLPTGGPVENNEVAMGPMMIQGDHGAVAIRNFQYKLTHDLEAQLTDLRYEVYYGDFQSAAQVTMAATADLEGISPQLTYEVCKRDNGFGLIYTGKLKLAEDSEYWFDSKIGGSAQLKIDGEILHEGWRTIKASRVLKSGNHDFEFIYYKTTPWMDPFLGLTISSTNGHPKNLHQFSSFPPNTSSVSPILISPSGNQPRLLRAFLDYGGDRNQRLTHSIGVGESSGINYVYDLASSNLVCVWKGAFVDATPMWHDRGDGSFDPLGMIQYLFNSAPVNGEIISKGYQLDAETGRPTFVSMVNGSEIKDAIYPDASGSKLIREISSDNAFTSYKIAESSSISKMSNGLFVIGDKAYYIEVLSDKAPEIHTSGNLQTLVISGTSTIKYSVIW